MSHEEPSGEAVDAAAERVECVFRALDPEACQRVGLALRHAPAATAFRQNGDGVVELVPARLDSLVTDLLEGSRHEPELAHDSSDQPATAPAVREHREGGLLLRNEQEKRLVAAHRSLVIEREALQQPRQ